jgi:hypothetical protein
MVNWVKNDSDGAGRVVFGADRPVTAHERFVRGVYASVDEATARGLDRLRREDGVVASCRRGCAHCCSYHIVTNIAEAHALVQYVKRELSAEQIDDLRGRTRQWHEWDNAQPGRHPSVDLDERAGLASYTACCPLLVDGACIAYPVRPVVCRTHFVCSHPVACRAAIDSQSREDAPVVLASVVTATSSYATAMKDYVEEAGLDFSRSKMLLPHWLAVGMGWEFALSL